jgi:dihydroxy-acid dehydratase
MAKLRSGEWYAGDDRNAYLHRAWMRRGAPPSAFSGRPQIAIANTASDLTPCNSHLIEVADAVKQGVYEARAMELLRRTAGADGHRSVRVPEARLGAPLR